MKTLTNMSGSGTGKGMDWRDVVQRIAAAKKALEMFGQSALVGLWASTTTSQKPGESEVPLVKFARYFPPLSEAEQNKWDAVGFSDEEEDELQEWIRSSPPEIRDED